MRKGRCSCMGSAYAPSLLVTYQAASRGRRGTSGIGRRQVQVVSISSANGCDLPLLAEAPRRRMRGHLWPVERGPFDGVSRSNESSQIGTSGRKAVAKACSALGNFDRCCERYKDATEGLLLPRSSMLQRGWW